MNDLNRAMKDFSLSCPTPLSRHATVQMAHGGGGRLMRELIAEVFLSAFAPGTQPQEQATQAHGMKPVGLCDSPLTSLPSPLSQSPAPRPAPHAPPHDAAVLPTAAPRLALTTDGFVVNPLWFPGGDIGKLAVCGTVNDLAMAGARPAYLTASFIIEEGFSIAELRRIVESMAATARECNVGIVAGDTKVVDRGKADGLFITTAGVGWVPEGVDISPARVMPGDAILLSGDLGRHGVAVMSVREGLKFAGALPSDCAALNGLVEAMLAIEPREKGTGPICAKHPPGRSGKLDLSPFPIHCLRDLTRGGLAAALNEIALDANVGISLDEVAIPVSEPVASACELLGLDPLYVANEGRLVAFVPAESAERVLAAMQSHPAAVGPAIIGVVTADQPGVVELRGRLGGSRIIDLLSGEQMPRIC
jgi:hydrogenase expression/formation protein HypE